MTLLQLLVAALGIIFIGKISLALFGAFWQFRQFEKENRQRKANAPNSIVFSFEDPETKPQNKDPKSISADSPKAFSSLIPPPDHQLK